MNAKPMKFHVQELRPEVLAFALMMEQRLRKHDAEKGASWKNMSARDLLVHAASKNLQMEDAQITGKPHVVHAADVANYCMMIADVSGGLTCGKHNDGHPCTMPAGSSCPDCGRSLIDYTGE